MKGRKGPENKTDFDQRDAAEAERMIGICFILPKERGTKTYKISMNFKFPLDKQ